MIKQLVIAAIISIFPVTMQGGDFDVQTSGEAVKKVDSLQSLEKDCPRIETCFSPLQDCSKVVIAHLADAKHTLDLALYSLTKDDIAQAIIDAHKRGVKVRLVIDRTQAGLKYADDEKLEEVGIPVYRIRGLKSGLMHHKFAIIDNEIVLSGSYNWTKGGTYRNSENLLVMDALVAEFSIEYERLIKRGERRKRREAKEKK